MDHNKINRYIELGNFLKTRRNKILPSQVGLPDGMRRRTPGLRREEVAQLAGISLTWYTWLEQGRSINVSDHLLEILSNILLLTNEERNHLFSLAAKSSAVNKATEQYPVSASLQNVLDHLDIIPAYIMDDRWNVIAWNNSAKMVFGDFGKLPLEERNIVWIMFNNSDYMSLFDDWVSHARGVLARFRASSSKYIDEDWYISFVSKLKSQNSSFDRWWSMYAVHSMSKITKRLTHPVVGSLSFEFNCFDVSDNTNLKLILHTPAPDTDTKEKMIDLLNKNHK